MDGPLRVLLIEDDKTDVELVLRALRKTFGPCEYRRVASIESLAGMVRTFEPHLAITDHRLPGFSGFEALTTVLRESPATPVIVVTGTLGEEGAADYIKAGAADFVLKNNLHRLGPAVTSALTLRDAREGHRRAEEGRARAEERFRALVEHSTDVITLLDAEGIIRYSSQSLTGALGYAPGERVGHSVFSVIRPEDVERGRRLFGELAGTPGAVVQTEVVAQHRDGSWRNVELVATNRLDDPVVAAIVVNWRDISMRKQAEKLLRVEQERQRTFFEASPLPMWIYDRRSLEVIDVNAAAVENYGYTRDEFLRLSLRDLRPASEVPRLEKVLAEQVGRRDCAGIWKHRKKDGTIIDVEVVTADLMLEGRALRVAALHDITERRRIAAEMEETQRMEAVGRLAGGVSHDFNNLLTVIEASTEFLLTDVPPQGSVHDDIELIRSAAREAAALTRQLLAFSRRQVLAPAVLNLNSFVPETQKMLGRLLGARVTIRARLAPDLGHVKLDPGQIQQILVNLSVNARDAMPNGGTILIETQNVSIPANAAGRVGAEASGDFVVLRVTDTGVGMDAATRARIFEPFFTTKERGKGTGLGLATVYGIVQQSGGNIRVRSAIGEGASFEIWFPRVSAPPEAERQTREGDTRSRGIETVLITEDDAIVRGLLVRSLRAQGYRVIDAANAAEAMKLAEAESEPVDLLLTDVIMPGMSGPELARRLRSSRPSLAVLFVSGYVEDDVLRDTAMQSGDALLQKPFGNEELSQAVRKALDVRRS